MLFKQLTSGGALTHRSLGVLIVAFYGALVLLSLIRHGEKSHCAHLTLRATSLLRDAAKNSLRAESKHATPTDRFMHSAKANIFVQAVARIMTPEEIARFGISIDELRTYSEKQLDDAHDRLKNPVTGTFVMPSFTR
jgi:hypothetical protein